jgi:hypothetical protein
MTATQKLPLYTAVMFRLHIGPGRESAPSQEKHVFIVLNICACSQLCQSHVASLLQGPFTLSYVLGPEVRYSAGTMSRCIGRFSPASYLEAVVKPKKSSMEWVCFINHGH